MNFVIKVAIPWKVHGHVKGVDITNLVGPMSWTEAKDRLSMMTRPCDPFYEALRYVFYWIEPAKEIHRT